MKWFLTKAADEFGVTRSTLERNLRSIGETIEPRKQYDTKLIHRALAGDLKFERTRAIRTQADILQLEHAERTGVLMSADRGDDLVRRYLLPVREAFLALPSEMASRVNPADPDHARQQLSDWVERAMRQIQGEITVEKSKAFLAAKGTGGGQGAKGVNGNGKARTIRFVRRGPAPKEVKTGQAEQNEGAEGES